MSAGTHTSATRTAETTDQTRRITQKGSGAVQNEEQRSEPAYRGFPARVVKTARVSPTFLRVTFTGDDFADFAPNGADQRVKIIFPMPDGGVASFPHFIDDSWYQFWRALPEGERNPMRTYTVREAREQGREVDVDFAIHPDAGPATTWAVTAQPGDSVVIIGPNRLHDGDTGGVEWRPSPDANRLLLVGDETAAPAICAILEGLTLRPGQQLTAIIEVPTAADILDVDAPAGAQVTWLPREGAEHGDHLIRAVRRVAPQILASISPSKTRELDDVDVDAELLWETSTATPEDDLVTPDFYAWLAGEAQVIKTLRRFLVRDLGIDRRQVSFMGYWRLGRAEVV